MRLTIVLSVAAAVTVMIGLLLMAASVVMRLLTRHQPAHMARLGLDVVAAGIVFGLVVLVFLARARIGSGGRSRSRAGTADRRRGAVRPGSAGQGRSPGHGPPVLNPTNMYSPGGLIDVPRDGRGPGSADGESIPEILRTAGPGRRRGAGRRAEPGPAVLCLGRASTAASPAGHAPRRPRPGAVPSGRPAGASHAAPRSPARPRGAAASAPDAGPRGQAGPRARAHAAARSGPAPEPAGVPRGPAPWSRWSAP